MTGRWVSLVGHDRMRLVVSGTLLEVTGCWGPASSRDRTDASGRHSTLSGPLWKRSDSAEVRPVLALCCVQSSLDH